MATPASRRHLRPKARPPGGSTWRQPRTTSAAVARLAHERPGSHAGVADSRVDTTAVQSAGRRDRRRRPRDRPTWCSTSARSTRRRTACCGCGSCVDGERIVSAEPIVGYMHRGAEKLFEVRDYRQIIVLANRHDWLSAFANELGVVLAVEQMLGMEVPERAVWTRTLLAELNRVLNHLMFLGSYPLELGAITPVFYAFREREELQAVMEEVSGGRMHYMFNRVGGLKEDLPAGWTRRGSRRRRRRPAPDARARETSSSATRSSGPARAASASSRRELAAAYGVSGPIARASGLDLDLRRDEPYLAYGELFAPGGPGRVVTRPEGDCLARLEVLLEQVHVSPRPRRGLSSTGCARCRRARSTSGCRRCSRCPRATSTAGPRTRSGSTATTSSPRATRCRGGSSCGRRPSTTSRCSAAILPGCLDRRHGRDPRVDVLRRRRRRQVGPPAAQTLDDPPGAGVLRCLGARKHARRQGLPAGGRRAGEGRFAGFRRRGRRARRAGPGGRR